MDHGKNLMALGGLAVGLMAGYFIPRDAVPVSSQPMTGRVSKSTRSAAETAVSRKTEAGKKLIQSMPAADDYSGREKWLEGLSASDLPNLMTSLCTSIGPDGLEYSDKYLLEKALKKWATQDREGALAWVASLPVGSTKRYFMKNLLAEILKDDSARALALSEAFQAEDPEWKHPTFRDNHIDRLISTAWKKPDASAEEMLELYSQLSRGTGTGGSALGTYPKDFDFQKFLEGIISENQKDKKRPSSMPTDVLEGWAKVNPSAAAQWFLESTEKQREVSFQDWKDIAKAVAEKSGPHAYYEWAADVISQASVKQLNTIVESVSDQDAIGIVSLIDDSDLRDQIYATRALKNTGAVEGVDQTLDFLAKISVPEARLRALKQMQWWLKKHPLEPVHFQKLGLTREQVSAALVEED